MAVLQAKPPKKLNQDPKRNKDPRPRTGTPGVNTSVGESSAARLPIGYPSVELYFSNEALAGSVPVMYLIPGQGQFAPGLDVFTFSDRLAEFKTMLRSDYDIDLKTQSNSIPIAFLPEAIPGIQLSNDYGASFLESITSIASPMLGQLGQMVGASNLREFIRQAPGQIGGAFGPRGQAVGDWLSNAMQGVGKFAGEMAGKATDAVTPKGVSNEGLKNIVRTGVDVVGAMLMGSRVDFPKVWMGSGFSGPVSIPIRLYNPDQTSDLCYEKFIIEPLTVLLMLGAPLSDQDNLYRWPYIHQIWCPGLFKWKMASVVGLTVAPGPENQMSWNNRPSMIDVRLDFQPLHSVMLGRRTSSSVPAVGDYLDQLRSKTTAPRLWDVPAGAPNVTTWASSTEYDDNIYEQPGTPTQTVDVEQSINPPNRVNSQDITDYEDLQDKQNASAQNPAQDRIMSERAALIERQRKEDTIAKAKEGQEALDLAQAESAQKAMQDKILQDQLVAADATMGALPDTQANQFSTEASGPSDADFENQKMAGDLMDDIAYTQSADGAPPGDSQEVSKEVPEGGKAPGQTNSFWGGVSSKLSAAGTAVVAAGKSVGTAVVDGASYKARQLSNVIEKVTGKAKDAGQEVKTTVTKTTTVEEVRKADTFPTTSEEGVKAQVDPTAAQNQEKMQQRSTAIAIENQSYTTMLAIYNDAYSKAVDPTTKSQIQSKINNLNSTHETNLAAIEHQYS